MPIRSKQQKTIIPTGGNVGCYKRIIPKISCRSTFQRTNKIPRPDLDLKKNEYPLREKWISLCSTFGVITFYPDRDLFGVVFIFGQSRSRFLLSVDRSFITGGFVETRPDIPAGSFPDKAGSRPIEIAGHYV